MRDGLQGRELGPDWRVATHTEGELVLEQRAGGWRKAGLPWIQD